MLLQSRDERKNKKDKNKEAIDLTIYSMVVVKSTNTFITKYSEKITDDKGSSSFQAFFKVEKNEEKK